MAYPESNPTYSYTEDNVYPLYEFQKTYLQNSERGGINIIFNGWSQTLYPNLTNDNIVAGSFEFTRSLKDTEDFEFSTFSSMCKFTITNYPQADPTWLLGREITVQNKRYDALNHAVTMQFGVFIIREAESHTYSNGMTEIECVAYDKMCLFERNVAPWYENIYPLVTTVNDVNYLLRSLCSHIGVDRNTDHGTIPSRNLGQWMIPKTITTNSLSGRDVLDAIAQFGCCIIGFDYQGKLATFTVDMTDNVDNGRLFEYIPKSEIYEGGCTDSFYYTDPIKRIVLGSNEEDIGATIPDEDYEEDYNSTLYILDNFLTYGMNHNNLVSLGNNQLPLVNDFGFRPMTIKCCHIYAALLYPGSNIYIKAPFYPTSTTEQALESIVQKITVKGITAMEIEIESKGNKKRPDLTTRDNFKTIQIKKKMMKLQTTVDGISADIEEISSDMETITEDVTRIDATAQGLTTTVSQHTSKLSLLEDDMEDAQDDIATLTLTAQGLQTQVSSKVGNNEIISKINQSAESITINASKINLVGAVGITAFDSTLKANWDTIAANANWSAAQLGTWCYDQDVTLINGGKLATGTVIADNIRADAVISNKVTATNLQVSGTSKIAGWFLTEDSIVNEDPFTGSGIGGRTPINNSTGMGKHGWTWAFWAGDGSFYVKQDGEFQATKGTIGGMVIDGNLGLGILPPGQQAPSFTLSVNEQALLTYDASTKTGVKIGWGNILIQNWNADGTRTDVTSITAGQATFGTNLLCIGSGTFWGGVSSDERVKHDIVDLDDRYLNVIKEINPKEYCYNKDKTNRRRVGVVAQELLSICKKNNIIEETNGLAILGEDGYYGVDYNGLAVSELLWLRDLENRISRLEALLIGKED